MTYAIASYSVFKEPFSLNPVEGPVHHRETKNPANKRRAHPPFLAWRNCSKLAVFLSGIRSCLPLYPRRFLLPRPDRCSRPASFFPAPYPNQHRMPQTCIRILRVTICYQADGFATARLLTKTTRPYSLFGWQATRDYTEVVPPRQAPVTNFFPSHCGNVETRAGEQLFTYTCQQHQTILT